MITSPVHFTTASGRSVNGALALPSGAGAAPAVIVVHEWWGLNDDMRGIASRLASEGFAALAIDLYGGRSTTSSAEAMALVQEMKTMEAIDVVEGAMQFLRAAPRSNGKVGITGFCVGGAISLAAACNVDGLGAVVPFYGIPLAKYADYSRVRAPIQGHYGEKDGSIPLEKPRAVEAAVRAAGGKFELCVYDAGHAFMRESDPAVYQPDAARLAWSRAISFLHEHLG